MWTSLGDCFSTSQDSAAWHLFAADNLRPLISHCVSVPTLSMGSSKEGWEIGFIHTCTWAHIAEPLTQPLSPELNVLLYCTSESMPAAPERMIYLRLGTAWFLFSFFMGPVLVLPIEMMMLVSLANSHVMPSSGLEILISLDNDFGDFKHFLLLVKLPTRFSSKWQALSIQVKI